MSRLAAVVVLLALASSASSQPAHAKKAAAGFSICRKDDDCMSADHVKAGTVVCNYVANAVGPNNTQMKWGYCVQCTTDCDCNHGNEVCVPAVSVEPSAKWWTTADFALVQKAYRQPLEDLFASWAHGTRMVMGSCSKVGSISKLEKARDGASCNPDTQQTPTMQTDKAFCGFVENYQPDVLPCIGSLCANKTLQNPNKGNPGSCGAFVNGSTNPAGCDGGVIWTGTCANRKCKFCSDGQNKCNSFCVHNSYHENKPNDGTIRTLTHNYPAQTELTITVMLGAITVVSLYMYRRTADEAARGIVYTKAGA